MAKFLLFLLSDEKHQDLVFSLRCSNPWVRANRSIASNRLTSVPESIVNLPNLEYLNLDRNRLQSLPEIIGRLTSLQYLYDSYASRAHNAIRVSYYACTTHAGAGACTHARMILYDR